MVKVGKVVVNQHNQVSVKINEPQQTLVQSPSHTGHGLSVGDLLDVDNSVLGNNYTLVYNSLSHLYHTSPMPDIDIGVIDGGTY